MASKLNDLRGVHVLPPKPARCHACGDTGLVAIEGAPKAKTWRDIPREYLPCVACPVGDQKRAMFITEGWLQ